MKYLFICLLFLFTEKGCQNSRFNNNQTTIIEYSESSRGFYYNVVINENRVLIQENRTSKPQSYPLKREHWNSLLKSLKIIDIEQIPFLKIPSEERSRDRAIIASLKITQGATAYETPEFDHNNPPKKIKALVKEILSISKNIEKQ